VVYLKKQVATEVNGVEWLRKGPLSIESEMGVGHILADQGKNGVMALFFEVPYSRQWPEFMGMPPE